MLSGFLRIFELTAHGNRTTQACDNLICGICQPLHSWLTCLCSIRAQNTSKLKLKLSSWYRPLSSGVGGMEAEQLNAQ